MIVKYYLSYDKVGSLKLKHVAMIAIIAFHMPRAQLKVN